jgi:hypothetical protein
MINVVHLILSLRVKAAHFNILALKKAGLFRAPHFQKVYQLRAIYAFLPPPQALILAIA